MGREGRTVVLENIARLRQEHSLDVVVVNGENAASGFGITTKIANQFFDSGIDVITTGNHVWDQRELLQEIDNLPRLLRPANYPEGTPGKGHCRITVNNETLIVINVMGQLFMQGIGNPIAALDEILKDKPLNAAVLIDVHAEATSEKQIIANYYDGRVSAVVGTHTHVPTADARMLPGSTCYITDVGMCGDYDSIIGMKKANAIQRYVSKLPGERFSPATQNAVLCGVVIETDPVTGKGKSIQPIRVGKI